jgi:hypothetical protein
MELYSKNPAELGLTVISTTTGLEESLGSEKANNLDNTALCIEEIKEIMRESRKCNSSSILIEQRISDSFQHKSKAPFQFYLNHVLKHGDQVPRGKFFKNHVAGKPIIICDELWYHHA